MARVRGGLQIGKLKGDLGWGNPGGSVDQIYMNADPILFITIAGSLFPWRPFVCLSLSQITTAAIADKVQISLSIKNANSYPCDHG